MPLPSIDSPISQYSLFPDRLELTFPYHSPISRDALYSALRARRFKFRREKGHWAGDVSYGLPLARMPHAPRRVLVRPQLLSVAVSRKNQEQPIYLSVSINPLRELRHFMGTVRDERACIREEDNWFPAQYASLDMRDVWRFTDELIAVVFGTVTAFLNEIHEAAGMACEADVNSAVIRSLEIALDLAAANPRQLVIEMAHVFDAQFKHVEHRLFRSSATLVQAPGAAWMLSGYRAANQRYKVYAKTDRRVRFECQMSRRAICDAVDISPRILNTPNAFFELFGTIAKYCIPSFTALHRAPRTIHNLNSKHTVFDLIARLAGAFRSEQKFREFLDVLLRTGRIKNSHYDQAVKKLKGEPAVLVDALTSGHSTISPAYLRAAWQIAGSQTAFSVASPRRRHGRLPSIRVSRPSPRGLSRIPSISRT